MEHYRNTSVSVGELALDIQLEPMRFSLQLEKDWKSQVDEARNAC